MTDLRKNIQTHMQALCLDCGSRHCGSVGEHKAAAYIEAYLKSLGVEVISEEFPVRGWHYESFDLFNVTQNRPVPGVTACYFSGACNTEGQFLFLEARDIDRLEEIDTRGRLCFVKHTYGVWKNNAIAETLEKQGAAGVIFISTRVAADTKVVRSPFIGSIATGSVDVAGLYDILKYPEDTYRLHAVCNPFDTVSRNVIARLGSGSKKAVIGAHYDTAPLVQGANDDASGTAIVLEFARLLKDRDLPLTLDLALFSAEEYVAVRGPMGSLAYVNTHKQEDIRWFMAVDDYGAKVRTETLKLGHAEKLPPLRHNYPVEYTAEGGDNVSFGDVGIPTVWLYDSPTPSVIHTRLDNLDFVDFDTVTEGAHKMLDLLEQLLDAEKDT